MKILINLENSEDFREIQIEPNDTLETLKYIIEAEFSIPYVEQDIKYEEKSLVNYQQYISSFKISENDILILCKHKKNTGSSLVSAFDDVMKKLKENKPLANTGFNTVQNEKLAMDLKVNHESKQIQEHYTKNPGDLAVLFNTDPQLAEAICAGDQVYLQDFIRKRMEMMMEKKKKKEEEEKILWNSDPNDMDAQKKIEEIIRQKNINENFKMAQEYLPETLLPIHMLYIPLEINKHKIIALVDTGAQMTIMGQECCKKSGLFNMVDTRAQGTAIGVGSSKILGVIHAAQIKINDRYL